jgi:ribosome-associated protein
MSPTKKTAPTTPLEGEPLARICLDVCQDRQAKDIVLFDVTGRSILADYYLICSGNSEPHLRAICNHLQKVLAEKGVRPQHVDGAAASQWIVMDYGDVLVHIFHPEIREYYQLETLWEEEKIIFRSEQDETGK